MLSWSCSGNLASILPPWFGLRDWRGPDGRLSTYTWNCFKKHSRYIIPSSRDLALAIWPPFSLLALDSVTRGHLLSCHPFRYRCIVQVHALVILLQQFGLQPPFSLLDLDTVTTCSPAIQIPSHVQLSNRGIQMSNQGIHLPTCDLSTLPESRKLRNLKYFLLFLKVLNLDQ